MSTKMKKYNFQDKSILIVDDDINLCKSLKYSLIESGAVVQIASNGREGILRFEERLPDLVLLDIRMPELDGWETAKYMRMISNTPIVMLTSLKEDHDVLRGLNLGVDDYIAKPFNPDILWARVANILSRVGSKDGSLKSKKDSPIDTYKDDYLSVDLSSRDVFVEGERVKLSTTEFNLLSFMIQNANRLIVYSELLENVWGKSYVSESEYVRVYISYLRRKIEKDPRNPKYILNEYRRGYRFVIATSDA